VEWDSGTTSRLARTAEVGLRVAAAVVCASAVLGLTGVRLTILLEFFLFALIARALSVPFGRTALDLEAAAVFPAVMLSESWQTGVVLAATAVIGTRLVRGRGRLDLRDADDTADIVLAYGASCFFSVSLGRSLEGHLAAVLLFAGTLLVFFFARVVLGALHATAHPEIPVPALIRAAVFQFLALILLSPAVALVVILEPLYGFGGAALAFTSVALVSASLRNLAQARTRTAELARQNRELQTLRAISMDFASAASDADVFERLFHTLQATLPVRGMVGISLEDDEAGEPALTSSGEVTLDRRSILEWLERQRELEATFLSAAREPSAAMGANRDLVLNPALGYQVTLPLQTPELIAGLIVCESADASFIEPETIQGLSVLADHVALSLQDRNLKRQMQTVNERLQGRAETLQRILDVSNELKSHLTLDHVLLNIVRAVGNSLGFNVVLLSLYDRTESVFERRAQVGLDAMWDGLSRQKLPREEIARWFSERFRISKSYFVSHVDRFEPDESVRRGRPVAPGSWHAQDLLFIPLTAGDQIVGVVQVDEPKNGRVPTLEDVQALEIFMNQAVTAIQSARAYETTRQMSVRDSLTEAYNHRYFQETLYRELTRHERSGQPLAVAMVDIDDFKKINDRFGHPVGDIVLKGLVQELLKGVREMDTVARYGGEEFALILPETTPEKALVVADRLRSRVAARHFLTPDVSHPLSVTISIGLACFPEDANSKRALIERADQALYQAKRTGKNCVLTVASLPPDGVSPGPWP
jgi:diguanylate cyclase (GGDEF)-like protein